MSLGIGMGCVGVALMSLLTLWATPRSSHVPTAADVAPAACAYFLGSCTVLALSIAAYLLFFYLPYVQHHSLPAGAASRCSSKVLIGDVQQLLLLCVMGAPFRPLSTPWQGWHASILQILPLTI